MLDPSRAHEETVDEPEEMEEDDLVGEEVWPLTKLTKSMVLSHIFHFCLHCNSETLIFFFHSKESLHPLVIHNAHRILGFPQRDKDTVKCHVAYLIAYLIHVALLTIPENTQEFKTKKQKAVAGKVDKVDDSWFEEGASEEPAKKGTIEPATQAQVRCAVFFFSIQTDFFSSV